MMVTLCQTSVMFLLDVRNARHAPRKDNERGGLRLACNDQFHRTASIANE